MAAVAEEPLSLISEPDVCLINKSEHIWERTVSVPVDRACSRCGFIGIGAQEGWREIGTVQWVTSTDCLCRGMRVMLDIIHGLEYLHGQNIAHLDLKSPNILIDRDGMAKIADVGLSKLVGTIEATATSSGSLLWAAPEQINMKVRCSGMICVHA